MAQTVIPTDLHVAGHVTCRTLSIPSNTVDDNDVAADADISAVKLQHQYIYAYSQAVATNVAAGSSHIHIAYGDGEIVDVSAALCDQVPTVDRTVTIDVKKSNEGGAFATILDSALVLNNTTVLRIPVAATLDDTELEAGDILKVTVAVAGSSGDQPQGLIVSITWREAAA